MNSLAEEYIGSVLEILQSRNSTLKGVKGKVLDETKHSFLIQANNKKKRIMKKGNMFKINEKIINGDKINKRPEERIKLK